MVNVIGSMSSVEILSFTKLFLSLTKFYYRWRRIKTGVDSSVYVYCGY